MNNSLNVSILVLTRNEEANIERCLKSVAWADDLVVLDSLSTDGTQKIARDMGARVIERQFDDYATQRNYGLNQIKYKHDWVMMVDADEVVTCGLADEINSVLAKCSDQICLYHVRRKDYYRGKWIKHCHGYPTWFGQLARIGHVTVKRAINEEYHSDGKIAFLKEHLLHYPFSKGLEQWFERHNRYSSMEAKRLIEEKNNTLNLKDIPSNDPVIRRKAMKKLAYRMPARPLLVFLYLYFLRRGFLDGRAGISYSTLRATYEFMINEKIKELYRNGN